MRRLVLVAGLLVLPATPVLAADLDELLDRSSEASFSAEQIISCSTPDGVRDALLEMEQDRGTIRVNSPGDDAQLSVGAGGWTVRDGDGFVSGTSVDSAGSTAQPRYVVEDGSSVEFLGRSAMSYRLLRDGTPRAELVFDDATGALMHVVTLSADGSRYCERRFVSFEQGLAELAAFSDDAEVTVINQGAGQGLPGEVAGFEMLDVYEDADGFAFAYYSDGFFSFAVFQARALVEVPGSVVAELDSGIYNRSFSAGYVTYAWQGGSGGMALVGDLPPDLHAAVLSEFPHPRDPGIFRRWWRALFG